MLLFSRLFSVCFCFSISPRIKRMLTTFHSFHIVSISPWPVLRGFAALALISSFVIIFKRRAITLTWFSFVCLFSLSFLWWRDVIRESRFLGDHSFKVQDGLKWGMALFILREVLFFFAWFWAFFHHRTAPAQEVGGVWPPLSIDPFNPFSVPLLNTAILLSSGVFVTWAHHNMVFGGGVSFPLFITILLGGVFTFFQGFEYLNRFFSIGDRAYGTTFFVSTGFHGAHVLVGTLFLLVCFFRCSKSHFVSTHHAGLEFSIWYWHFVDVVWLFLFSFIYWWGF